MNRYTCHAEVFAIPMTLGEYNAYRGWEPLPGEDPGAAGYLLEHEPTGQINHPLHAGPVTWTPARLFARNYSPS